MKFRQLGTLFALLVGVTAVPTRVAADDDDDYEDADDDDDDDADDDDDDDRRPTVKQDPRPIAKLVEAIAARNVAAIEGLLLDGVEQDIAFTDRGCASQFGQRGPVAKDQLPAFARCLAGLGARSGGTPTLLVYGPGIELEARAANEKVYFLGSFVPGAVMVAPSTLESLRTGGNSNLDDLVAKQLDFIVKRRNAPVGAWLRVCIAADGKLADVRAENSLANIGGVFAKAASETWKFRAFEVGGTPRNTCGFTHVAYPAGTKAHVTTRPTKSIPVPLVLHPPQNVAPTYLEELRTGGKKDIVPDDKTKRQIKKDKRDKLVGSWKLCIDVKGAPFTIKALKGTGYPAYDKRIETEMAKWRYKPFMVRGQTVPVCTAVTFIYQQK